MRRPLRWLCLLMVFTFAATVMFTPSSKAQEPPRYVGASTKGFVLPNGWTLSPAGEHIALTDLPLNIMPLADNQTALVSTSGYNSHELALVDLNEKSVSDRQKVRQSWFGLTATPRVDRIWWAGGGSRLIHAFHLADRHLDATPNSSPVPTPAPAAAGTKKGAGNFLGGLAFDSKRTRLYSLDVEAGTIAAYDVTANKELKTAPAGTRPYDVALARNGAQLFVSDWAGRVVRVLDPADLRTVARISVGEHPNQIAVHPRDDRVFVACASSDWVAVIDTRRGIVTETDPHGPFSTGARGKHARRAGDRARRQDAVRRQRR